MGLLTTILGFGPFIKIAFMIIEAFIGSKVQNDKSRKIFLDLAELLRENGIKSIQSRFEAEQQILDGIEEWEIREKPAPITPPNTDQ